MDTFEGMIARFFEHLLYDMQPELNKALSHTPDRLPKPAGQKPSWLNIKYATQAVTRGSEVLHDERLRDLFNKYESRVRASKSD